MEESAKLNRSQLTESLEGVIDVYIAFLIDICCGRIIGEDRTQARHTSWNEQ
jgi:hypothetical protein